MVSGPTIDGVDWTNRAMYLAPDVPNNPPTASFAPSCTNLDCSFDASGSSDSDGSITSYAWDFGDSQTGSGVSPSHSYTARGTYAVTLTVTDNKGATTSVSHNVSVRLPNVNPTAAFTSSCTAAACSFDASASADSDGTIANYSWDFGDGRGGNGASPAHTYDTAGTYSVALTVTDNDGGTDSVTHSVTYNGGSGKGIAFVAAANAGGGNLKTKTVTIPSAAHAGDTALLFLSRAATSTWTGPTGVPGWTQIGSNLTNGGLTTTVWQKQLAVGDVGSNVQFTTGTASHASVDVAVYSGVDGVTPVGQTATAVDISASNHTTASVNASAGNWIVSMWGDRSTATRTWTVPNSVAQRDASTDTGTLTVQAVVADSSGPVSAGATPTVTATTDANTDRTAMWTIELDAAPPNNDQPTAAFTPSCTDLDCSFDATASSDPDGTITGYSWDFGDTQSGTGASPSHSYSAGGTYPVTLTVTDNGGATNSVTHSVTVSPQVGIRFVGAANAGGGNVKTKTVTIPAAAKTGDTALMILSQPATTPWAGPTGVTGWTQVGSNFTNGGLTTTVWEKQLAAGDAGSNVQFTSSTFTHASVDVAVYSGVNAVTPVGNTATAQDTSASNHTTASVNAAGGSWVVSMWADRSTATRTWTVPGSVTQRDASTDTGALTFQAVVADTNGPVSAGATPTVTATTDANTDRTAMWTIELDSA